MVGRISEIRSIIVDIAKESGITTCNRAPSSGEVKADEGTINWTKPSMTSPKSFLTGGKKYDKALDFTAKDGSSTAHFEMFCDQPAMVVIYKKLDADGEVGPTAIFYYERSQENKDELYADLFLQDSSGLLSNGTLELAFLMRATSDNMLAWVTRTGTRSSGGSLGYRYAINKEMDGDKLSYYIVEVGTPDGISSSSWKSKSAVTSEAVSGAGASSTAGLNNDVFGPEQGCASSWDFVRSTQTSAETCDNLDLKKGPATALDEDGDLSLGWIKENLPSLIGDL